MYPSTIRRRAALAAAAAATVLPAVTRAQGGYPDRPVKLVVPFPPGQAADTFAASANSGVT